MTENISVVNNNILFIISIIGCVTGVCSLVISFYKTLSERPKLKINDGKFYLNGFYDNPYGQLECKKFLIINVSLNNLCSNPITVKDVKIKSNKIHKADNHYLVNRLSFNKSNGETIEYPLHDVKNLPLTLQPFDCSYNTFLFPFADEIFKQYKSLGSNPMKVTVRFYISTKTVKYRTKVFELNLKSISDYKTKNHKKFKKM